MLMPAAPSSDFRQSLGHHRLDVRQTDRWRQSVWSHLSRVRCDKLTKKQDDRDRRQQPSRECKIGVRISVEVNCCEQRESGTEQKADADANPVVPRFDTGAQRREHAAEHDHDANRDVKVCLSPMLARQTLHG